MSETHHSTALHASNAGQLPLLMSNSGNHVSNGAAAVGPLVSGSALPLASAAPPRRKPKRAELSEDQRMEIKEAFELFDTEKTGTIGFHELKVCLKAFGFNVKKKDIIDLRREYDQKQTGRIDFIDFSDIMTRKISERDPLDEVKKAFRLFDDDSTGRITLKNLRRVARELGETLSDDELQAMIDEFDMDNDGEISEQEFIAIMTQSALL